MDALKWKKKYRLTAAQRKRVADNLGLIGKMVTLIFSRQPWVERMYGKNRDEAFQQGVFGLARAAQKYNPRKRVRGKSIRFSTYAMYWIRQSIQRPAGGNYWSIHIPEHVRRSVVHRSHVGGERTENERDAERAMIVIGVSEKVAIGDRLPTELDKDDLAWLKAALLRLPRTERLIIFDRFGLFGRERKTLEQIGDGIGRTRERVRQLESRALRRLQEMAAEVSGLVG
jgi:RNA polymerase primary sigma factor